MKEERVALIFSTVWPEPNSSAAGVRQFHWIEFLRAEGYQVILSSPSKLKGEEDWGKLELPEGVRTIPFPLNEEKVGLELKALAPEIVLFDRFILEEQFGHLVYEHCPQALVLLETQDLHFVRRAREERKENFLTDSLSHSFYQTETALRETASIERVDYSFVVSSFEEKLLREKFSILDDRASWLPFFYEEPSLEKSYDVEFSKREGFVWIGNFRHAPNVDGLRWFRKEIWPRIRLRFPGARLKIFGAYPSKEVMEWNQPEKTGISVLGSAATLDEVFMKARVNLAPLRFGAGIKGKILEGFRYGIPVVTTKVGVEGILPESSSFDFPGAEANTVQAFTEACLDLYQNEALWNERRDHAKRLMSEIYSGVKARDLLCLRLRYLQEKKQKGELPRWNSKILRHELFNSHKYFAKWIESKNAEITGKINKNDL